MPTLRKTSEGLGDDESHPSVTAAETSFSIPTIPPFRDFDFFDNEDNQTNESSSSLSSEESLFDDALLKDITEETSKSISATQEELIRDEMEEIAINEEAGDAEVNDTNTNVDLETIKKWRSLIVTDHYGNEHNKHLLVRSFFSSHGLQLARDPHSTDRIKRVRGEMRYARVDPNVANSNSVIQAFNIAEKISERSFSVGGLDSTEDELQYYIHEDSNM
jgi:hypothetical protein